MATQSGGKYIYEGSYGCTFHPALPCINTGTRKGLGKVFNNIKDFKQEEKIQKFKLSVRSFFLGDEQVEVLHKPNLQLHPY